MYILNNELQQLTDFYELELIEWNPFALSVCTDYIEIVILNKSKGTMPAKSLETNEIVWMKAEMSAAILPNQN